MSSISAGTSTGTALVQTGDTTGALVFKTGASATTAMTIGADQSVVFAGTVSGGLPGSGGATASGSVTLTSTSAGAQSITTTTYGQTVTLPNATTLNDGACLYTIKNEGLFDLKIVNAAGTTKGFIRPLTTTNVGLSDNSTSAGTWVFDNAQILGISAFNEYASTQQFTIKYIAIDSSRDLLILEGTSGLYGLIYNKTTNVWGTITLIRTAASLASVSLKTATDQVLVVSCPYTTAVEAVVLTLTGTSITVGIAATATLAGALSAFNSYVSGGITAVGSTFVFSYTRTGINGIRGITISGTTPTIGAETSASGTSVPARLYAVSSSVLLTISIANSSTIYCVPYSVSGTTLTIGTGVNLSTTGSPFYTMPLGTRWAVVYLNTNSTASIINVTGTTATASTATLNAVANISDWALVGTKIVVASLNNAIMYIRYFSDNSGTINVSNAITQVDQNNYGLISLFAIDSNTAGASYFVSGSRSYVSTLDISTATPVLSLKMLTPISSPAIVTTNGSVSGVTGDIAALNFDGKWLNTNLDAFSAAYSGITLYTKSGAIIIPTMLLSTNSVAYAASNYAYFRSNFVGFSVCFQILEMAQ